MGQNLMICTDSKKNLKKINESAIGGKYVLEGVFAELDKMNRNQRIYTKEEYLKHLQYLRDDIKKGEPLLGELDHPDDRFEVKLKEASHRVIDLWYDSQKNVIMGKIELLNTPNGKLAQSLVDQGVPLHISSRAAGNVNEDDNTVEIQQIYTYDLVCKPGFAGAVLHRVNESAGDKYSKDVYSFFNKINNKSEENVSAKYGVLNEDTCIYNMNVSANLRKEAIALQENQKKQDMKKNKYSRLFEEDEEKTSETGSDEGSSNGSGSGEGSEKGSSDGDSGVEILAVKPATENEDGELVLIDMDDVELDLDDEDEEDDEDTKDEEDEDEDEAEDDETSGSGSGSGSGNGSNESKNIGSGSGSGSGNGSSKSEKKTSKDSNDFDKDKKLNDNAKESLKENKKKFNDKLEGLKAKIDKKEKSMSDSKCESVIYAQYPISMMLTERNFAKFASLTESQKNKVVNYLMDKRITNPRAVNEKWEQGLSYNSEEPLWLKYAPGNYKSLYEHASKKVQESLADTAKYLILESQYDINTFWENSGLMEAKAERSLNESFIKNMPKINNEKDTVNDMPYSTDFIDSVVEMACRYNKRY